MAHVSEILFYFYSTVLWQPLVYNTEIPCVYTLSIGEDSKIWNTTESGLHSQYIRQLLNTIENEWNLKIIQPKSCLDPLVLPSDASISDPDISSRFATSASLFSEENSWPLVCYMKCVHSTTVVINVCYFFVFRGTSILLSGYCIQRTLCS